MNEVLFPTMEKSAKKRNSWPGGITSVILMMEEAFKIWTVGGVSGKEQVRRENSHGLAIRIPRADKQAVESLVQPNFPNMLKAEVRGPDSDAAPESEYQDPKGIKQKHSFCWDLKFLLYDPKGTVGR